jgi:hypothetical protein
MMEFLVLAGVWLLVLVYVAAVPKEAMQMTWLALVLLVLLSPVIALIWPQFR